MNTKSTSIHVLNDLNIFIPRLQKLHKAFLRFYVLNQTKTIREEKQDHCIYSIYLFIVFTVSNDRKKKNNLKNIVWING